MSSSTAHDKIGENGQAFADNLREILQPVAGQEEHAPHAAVAHLGQDAHPERCALAAGGGPQPRMSLSPSSVAPMAAYNGRIGDLSVPHTLTTMASMKLAA